MSRKSATSGGYKRKLSGKPEPSEEQKNDINAAFNLFDPSGSGFMEAKDLKFAMRALGFEPRKEEVKKLLAEIDKQETGKIAREDFMNVMATRLAEKDINEEIMKAFQLFDEDNTGKISFKNLKSVAKQLSENLSDEELQQYCIGIFPTHRYFCGLETFCVESRVEARNFLKYKFPSIFDEISW
ncbi:uncharacterized protein LOC119396987 isoform X1 [Rhipicephalus sanguineus]|uniref:uncharacterized protein LOC119396987 isoform X1 n=1 Tax=Rhipicephalus sanguineus TaxID=34632 RepID=UPI0020C25BB6|nr:uncharacterized protein LOC119396987 isoform X1 [Rhipicephalus sanguineus]